MSQKIQEDGGDKKFADDYRKLFIGGLTYNTTDDMLRDYYSKWGNVVDCIVMRDANTKRSRGFGFVTYSDSKMLDEAMAARPHVIDEKAVEPKRAIPRDMSSRQEARECNLSVKRLYVSGVREGHTEQTFKEYFCEFGNVIEVEVFTDKVTGKPRGFAFVTFDDYDSVDKCVLQKSHMIDGYRCDVKKALSKEETRKSQQQERERAERNHRSRGMARGGGGDAWSGGGGNWNQKWDNTNSWGSQNRGGPMWNSGGGGYGSNQGYGAANNGWGQGGGGYSGGPPGGYGNYGGGGQGWGGPQPQQGGWAPQMPPRPRPSGQSGRPWGGQQTGWSQPTTSAGSNNDWGAPLNGPAGGYNSSSQVSQDNQS